MIKEHSDLFSDSQCKICSAVLISESQKLTHYQVSEPTVCCCIQVSGTLQFFVVVVVVLTMLICLVIKDLLIECTIHPDTWELYCIFIKSSKCYRRLIQSCEGIEVMVTVEHHGSRHL